MSQTSVYRFTTNSANYATTFKEIPFVYGDGPPGSSTVGDQMLCVNATTDNAAGVVTGCIAWMDTKTYNVVHVEEFVATATGYTVNTDGTTTTQGYVCTVAFTFSGNNKIDLIGCGPVADRRTGTGFPTSDSTIKPYIGVKTAFTSSTLVDFFVTTSRTI